jgi:hypothetical protein
MLRKVWSKVKSRVKAYRKRNNWDLTGNQIELSPEKSKLYREKGFKAICDMVYELDKYPIDDYLNDRDYGRLHPINGASSKLIDSKAFVPIVLGSCPEAIPELSIWVSNGVVRYCQGVNVKSASLETVLESCLEVYPDLCVKPISDGGGRGVFFIKKGDYARFLPILQQSEYYINNKLVNEPYSELIFPGSLNTIRVTFFRNLSNENVILSMAHRFGTKESNGVDNNGQGGIACSLDIETGRISQGYIRKSKTKVGRHNNHVDTNHPLEGFIIPDWTEKLKLIRKVVDSLYFLDIAGIDFAATATGLKVLEINSLPAPLLSQASGPLFLNPEFREFIARKGYPLPAKYL